MYTARQYGFGTWEGSLIIRGVPALMYQVEGHLILIFNMDIVCFWPVCLFSFIIKADVYCVFDRPQTGYFS